MGCFERIVYFYSVQNQSGIQDFMKKVLGLGNALVDILVKLDNDDILNQYNLEKGSMKLVDREFVNQILGSTSKITKKTTSGGSAANTIHGLSHLGVDTAFIGKVGKDEYGYIFENDLTKNNIKPILMKGIADTGRAVALITPDSERTFTTYLGSAIELTANDINENLFKGYDFFHIEGYLVQNQELTRKALQYAKSSQLTISLDLANFHVVNANKEFLKDIISKYVDIVFANEDEATSLTGLEASTAVFQLAEICDIAVVKLGANGSVIKKAEHYYRVKAFTANAIDTTGAGDLYASGFLYGLAQELPLNKCGEIGSLVSSKVVEVIGPKLDRSEWDMITDKVNRIIKS